eukprot:XP_001697703.1 predicted protein [Chlamydomonas reinhardtii]
MVGLRHAPQRQQQQTGLASPVVKFARCSRLEVRAVGVSDPVSTVLAGSSPAAAVRERITHLVVSGWGYNQHRVAEAVAAKLPCLEELELLNDGGGSYIYSQGDRRPPPQGGICGILGTAGLPALRRLTLSRATSADLEGLGALAACPQLRELVLPVPMPPPPQARGSTDDPTHAALEGLAQLQRLEQLTLGVDSTRFSSTSERFLAKLLSSHRPPQLRGLVLLTENDKAPVLELLISSPGGRWVLERNELEPGAALPRLLARCECVEADNLPSVYDPSMYDTHSPPAELLSAARMVGLPRALELRHGTLLCRDAVLGAAGATTEPAATATPTATSTAAHPAAAGGRELGLMLQQLGLGSSTGDGQRSGGGAAASGGGGLRLQLDTASPQEVLREAVERLWAQALHASGAAAAAGGGATGATVGGRSGGCEGASGSNDITGGGGGSGSSSDNMERLTPGLLLLRGKLPRAPERTSYFADLSDAAWADWLEDVLDSCFAAAASVSQLPSPAATVARQGPAATAFENEGLTYSVRRRLSRGVHVAAPEAGILLLECRSLADATALAAAMVPPAVGGAPAAFSAVAVPVRSSPGSWPSRTADAIKSGFFQVLTELWSRSGAAAGATGGGGSAGGGGRRGISSTRSMGQAGASRVTEGVLERLQQLMDLDWGVRELWSEAELEPDTSDLLDDDYDDDGYDDGYCYSYDGDYRSDRS